METRAFRMSMVGDVKRTSQPEKPNVCHSGGCKVHRRQIEYLGIAYKPDLAKNGDLYCFLPQREHAGVHEFTAGR